VAWWFAIDDGKDLLTWVVGKCIVAIGRLDVERVLDMMIVITAF
jgi:hypothetical protein